MHPRDLSISDFTYRLPEDRIAKYPLPERDSSRLLIYKKGIISEDLYKNIGEYIPPESLLVFNNTKVIEARILFQKPTGGVIEIFCLEPHEQYGDITQAMAQTGNVLWKCLVGGASKWKHGELLQKKIITATEPLMLSAAYREKRTDHFIIELSWSPPALSFAEMIHLAGAVPLPPYIKRAAEASDAERYQTVYARADGSVAAPTAGLHFTEQVFASLAEKNIQKDFVTLHVGAGTFKPVKSVTMAEHAMHAEYIDIHIDTIENVLTHLDKTIVAVGTTSLRTLESLYWLGLKLLTQPANPGLEIHQWEPYEYKGAQIPAADALQALLQWLKLKNKKRLLSRTQLMIAPGYQARIAKGLITNFHQPQSTLLLLVAALAGKDWKKIYDYALQHDFRFLSYGDGSLVWFS